MRKDSTLLRAKLLKTYNDLMYVQGYEQTTVRQIAEECGIGRGHLYFYFAKKERFPIDLRRDLLFKIDAIIGRELTLPEPARLLRFFLSMLTVRFMIANKPVLSRVQAEYASHTEVMDGFAELQYDKLDAALVEARAMVGREMLEEALLSATYAELVLLRYRSGTSHAGVNHLFLYHYFNTILFTHLDAIRPALEAASSRAVEIFTPMGPQLMDWVYQMEEFNYAPLPDNP